LSACRRWGLKWRPRGGMSRLVTCHHGLQCEAVVDVGRGDANDKGAVRSRLTGRASWNPVCPGPRGSDLCGRPLFRPDVGGVEDDAGDIDQAGVVEPVQDRFMEAAPDAGPGPDQEPAMRGRLRCPEARRQGPPGAAADQHIDDRREQRLIRCVLRAAALRPHLRRWDQRLRDLPQPVRNNPTPRTPPHDKPNDRHTT
jgi:hypothetical protein